MTRQEAAIQLEYWKEVRTEYQKAYLALVKSNVKYYMIDDRQLTRFDLTEIEAMMEKADKKINELEAIANGQRARKAFGIVPRDW